MKTMDLIADIGNSLDKFYLTDNDSVLSSGRLSDVVKISAGKGSIKRSIIVSVSHTKNDRVSSDIKKFTGTEPVILDHSHYKSLKSRYRVITELGMDRLCNAAFALKNYGPTTVVIDLGSAVTFEIIGNDGFFEGGMILPGLKTQAGSLSERTELLPETAIAEVPELIGHSTAECISSGIVHGTASACEGLIWRIAKRLGKTPKVILTGGHSGVIGSVLSIEHIIDKFTVPKGAVYIAEEAGF